MYYEINISLNGQHFFATDERSITSRLKLKAVYAKLEAAFPKSEGYELRTTKWENRGTFMSADEIKSYEVD